jgi:hypothetical protein
VDWSKVDATLAGALADAGDPAQRRLPVFIDVDPEGADPSVLAGFDVRLAETGQVCTATLSATEVDRLTDESWVRRVRLSERLRLLGGDEHLG